MKLFSIMFVVVMLFTLTSTSFAQIDWIKHPNPVLRPGPTGSWDDSNVSLACVLLFTDTLHMWYDGNWDNSGSVNTGIGHATSVDGINWIKDTLNPVLSPGPSNWDSHVVSQAAVLFNASDSLFHMWYMGIASANGLIYVGHATSSNGSNWIKDTLNPVLSPGNWDNRGTNGPTVILVNDTLHMFYGGFTIGSFVVRLGHATSTDWKSWQKDTANPVLNPGTVQDWDYPQVRGSKVIYDGFKFHIFYGGGSFPNYDVGYAYSVDGTNWTKYNDPTTTGNPYMYSDPVLKRGNAGDWDDDAAGTGSVLFNDNSDSLRMWYFGASNGPITSKIGYATSTIITGIKVLNENLPKGFVLQQNYPNPFNPTTNIEFSIPKSEFVILKVYNILSEEVATLVSEKLAAGSYKYNWDAGSLASGVYLYRIQAGNYVESRKMVMMK